MEESHAGQVASIISYFPLCYDKMPDKSGIRKDGLVLAHDSKSQSSVVDRTWMQTCEVAGHIAPIIRKQGAMDTAALPTFTFLSNLAPWPMEWCYLHSAWHTPP